MKQTIAEKIKQRRLQILVHSCIYYDMDKSIISDGTWSRWAKELVKLQNDNPEIAKTVEWDYCFRDFDGSTGMNLPTNDRWVRQKALKLLSYHEMQPKTKATQQKLF